MQLNSKKTRIDKFLQNNKFKKSTSTKSRVKGFSNIEHGYTFKKWEKNGEPYYLLYFICGNVAFRGMSVESQNEKTHLMLQAILEKCNLQDISISTNYYFNGVFCIEIK